MAYINKADQKAASHRHYVANKAKMIARSKAYTEKVHAELKEFIVKAKSVPCSDCGMSYPPYVMDFDHVSGEKRWNIGDYKRHCWTLSSLEEEIAKCEVVCANCHRQRTHERRAATSE